MNVHVYICVCGPLPGSSCPHVRVPLGKTPTPQIFCGDQAIASHDLTYDVWVGMRGVIKVILEIS